MCSRGQALCTYPPSAWFARTVLLFLPKKKPIYICRTPVWNKAMLSLSGCRILRIRSLKPICIHFEDGGWGWLTLLTRKTQQQRQKHRNSSNSLGAVCMRDERNESRKKVLSYRQVNFLISNSNFHAISFRNEVIFAYCTFKVRAPQKLQKLSNSCTFGAK